MTAYRVYLHGHAGVKVDVEAGSVQEANRLALQQAPNVRGVSNWTPVGTVNLDRAKTAGPDLS